MNTLDTSQPSNDNIWKTFPFYHTISDPDYSSLSPEHLETTLHLDIGTTVTSILQTDIYYSPVHRLAAAGPGCKARALKVLIRIANRCFSDGPTYERYDNAHNFASFQGKPLDIDQRRMHRRRWRHLNGETMSLALSAWNDAHESFDPHECREMLEVSDLVCWTLKSVLGFMCKCDLRREIVGKVARGRLPWELVDMIVECCWVRSFPSDEDILRHMRQVTRRGWNCSIVRRVDCDLCNGKNEVD